MLFTQGQWQVSLLRRQYHILACEKQMRSTGTTICINNHSLVAPEGYFSTVMPTTYSPRALSLFRATQLYQCPVEKLQASQLASDTPAQELTVNILGISDLDLHRAQFRGKT